MAPQSGVPRNLWPGTESSTQTPLGTLARSPSGGSGNLLQKLRGLGQLKEGLRLETEQAGHPWTWGRGGQEVGNYGKTPHHHPPSTRHTKAQRGPQTSLWGQGCLQTSAEGPGVTGTWTACRARLRLGQKQGAGRRCPARVPNCAGGRRHQSRAGSLRRGTVPSQGSRRQGWWGRVSPHPVPGPQQRASMYPSWTQCPGKGTPKLG